VRGAEFNAAIIALDVGDIRLAEIAPLVNGSVPASGPPEVVMDTGGWRVVWHLEAGGRFVLVIAASDDAIELGFRVIEGPSRLASLGLRFGLAGNVARYLRNGYTSWDGSYFVEPRGARAAAAADPSILTGHAATALVSWHGHVAVLGFVRHDRFQSRLRFDFTAGPLSLDVETLLDEVPFEGDVEAERLLLFAADGVEEGLRQWARHVAHASPLPPRLAPRRLTGWCSWYNLYTSLDEEVIADHLAAARAYRDEVGTPLDVFLIDDGFTPEMGDWLETKPQFPRGMRPVLDSIRAAGFLPGLWIAPFMVGNRSHVYAAHPDWVVKDRRTGRPLAPMSFYGEFRWHKRSEEYYVLDVTHPDAEAYIRDTFRRWAQEWGCGYFKADFMHLGSLYGPDEARWHLDGLSRIEIWMRMARLIREEICDAVLLACGSPVWAPIGLVDAMRVGRDIGVTWKGHYSAESLLRDQTARNFANGILWQADPDCVLLRDRFHDLTDEQVRSLAIFAGLAGGVLMTSDHLGEVSQARRALLRRLAGAGEAFACDFPLLGSGPLTHAIATGPTGRPMMVSEGDPVLVQRVRRVDGSVLANVFNTGDLATDRLVPWALAGSPGPVPVTEEGAPVTASARGVHVALGPHQSRQLTFETT
jgi:hypothetical protein